MFYEIIVNPLNGRMAIMWIEDLEEYADQWEQDQINEDMLLTMLGLKPN